MANANRPIGLTPFTQPLGGMRINLYRACTANEIFKYDPVTMDANGQVIQSPKADLTAILGVAVGFIDVDQAGFGTSLEAKPYLIGAAGNDAFVIVCDDPSQIYVAQADTGGGNLTDSNIGNSINPVWLQGVSTNSGSTVTGISIMELDASEAAADTGGSLVIVGKLNAVDNATGSWCKYLVKIAAPQLTPLKLGTVI